MESLGGDQAWRDRFAAQHAALVYYAVLNALWFLSPTLAYNFSELIEAHAVDTVSAAICRCTPSTGRTRKNESPTPSRPADRPAARRSPAPSKIAVRAVCRRKRGGAAAAARAPRS
jgi:hypothetical protein